MLKELHTVLPAADLRRAQAFYHDALELDPAEAHEESRTLVYRTGAGGTFEIYETSNAGTARNTQMCWTTDDLDAEMSRLRERGVVFEDYDVPGLKTVNGVAATDEMKSAWFRDTEGNFICIFQML
ncbi:VOC family protein [Cryobacterium sp. TMT1-21]|uniref:VOC family protein n=1 Tax=Cryobacterium shii TaxID=1259235 RepID=A0AAQ2HGN6_9MICO|nr:MULTISPECIES: VOC family protein [Cryobacterium]TFC52121.1 VOC family protein [Cryobacterium shii]TFC84675.1 VOC family protein [Cryobacterium sp. TmT2-59]TFD07324.1 VOC family protein [Cryobacterium sp. TMT1-21]TFD16267.1 VOC family protein [Cryobacterium sp. TMT2-23]TFD19072.1 VOC family protein [Cryobacterium sp. TMT4-10]